MSEMSDLLRDLIREAKAADKELASLQNRENYGDLLSDVHASMYAYFNVLFETLPEDHFFMTYIPERLEELRREIDEKVVMAKLESENG